MKRILENIWCYILHIETPAERERRLTIESNVALIREAREKMDKLHREKYGITTDDQVSD